MLFCAVLCGFVMCLKHEALVLVLLVDWLLGVLLFVCCLLFLLLVLFLLWLLELSLFNPLFPLLFGSS